MSARPLRNRLAIGVALALVAAGCGSQPETGATAEALLTKNGLSSNGLSSNGLSSNGMSSNGLSSNGLSSNGLSSNGLATADFLAWFEVDPVMSDMVMSYLTRCGMAAGQSLTFTWDDRTYTWRGVLGLAPAWASGQPIPPPEQQLMTACLAAHSNRFGLHVPLSVRGPLADGVSLVALDPGEDTTFVEPEACFFGNLYDGSGVYDAAFLAAWTPEKTNPRGCAVEAGLPGDCPPIQHLGSCADVCTPLPGVSPTVFGECAVNGVSYLPVTTYLQPSDVYLCGDGVCQFTESPDDPLTGLGCPSDCDSH